MGLPFGLLTNREIRMSKVPLGKLAPEFELNDYQGKPVRLADFRGEKNVVLIFNRGFT